MKTILYKLYAIKSKIIRKIIYIIINKLENGEVYSSTLRKIYKDYHNIEIGMYSYGGCFKLHNVPSGTKIGRYGSFARFMVFPRIHPGNFISTHPFFFNTKFGYVKNEIIGYNKLSIGHDVWIGENVFIMPSVKTIGNGAIIGTSAVVTKDVPPYAIVVGIPGKILRYRFPEETIKKIEKSAWWEKDIDEIKTEIEKYTKPYNENLEQ